MLLLVTRWMLSIAMLFSSVGMSVASMACAKPQKMRTSFCSACAPNPNSVTAKLSAAKRSCCQKVWKHLGLKTEYQRPASSTLDLASLALIAVLAEPSWATLESEAPLARLNTGPPLALASLDRCSLTQTFRI